jgi:cytochrome c biogenesis protein CcmG/thiol:disulfide interchange protein DsbE
VVRRHLIAGLFVAAMIAALIGVELLGGRSGARTGARAPQLPTSVLVPPRATLDSLRGEPAAINFWASWCHPCRKEAPELQRLARSLPARTRLVGVNWSDNRRWARSYVERYGWTFPNLRDPDGRVGQEYGLAGLPMTFILDSRGRIAEVLRGPQTESSIRAALGSAG